MAYPFPSGFTACSIRGSQSPIGLADDAHDRFRRDGGTGDRIDLIGCRALTLLHGADLRINGENRSWRQKPDLYRSCRQAWGFAALQNLHAGDLPLLRNISVQQTNGVLEPRTGTELHT